MPPLPRTRAARALATGAAAVALALAATASAKGGAFSRTAHGDPTTGVQRLPTLPRGDCGQCHSMHASSGGQSTGGPYPYALFAADDDALCGTCHQTSGAAGSYQGPTAASRSSHATSSSTVWPGPSPAARPSGDAGKCVNCHAPHGVADPAGVLPALSFAREEALCDACHDGSPAQKDVATLVSSRPYRHPVTTVSGVHRAAEGGDPTAYAASPTNNRHSECVDCHDPHVAQPDASPPVAPAASARLRGVGRVRVTNGGAGSLPLYAWVPPTDPSTPSEYEVCFKCHSSWTTQPAGQSNLALELNPGNPSFHPVEARGRNANVLPGAFANGWTWDRLVLCTDCHGSDDPTIRGAHGSSYRHILAANSPETSSTRMAQTDLCFRCHAWDTYASSSSSQNAQSQSRFNPPTFQSGHVYHVGVRGYSCWTCHESHGTSANPALVATGRSPGIRTYAQTATGGSCAPSCHGTQTYTVNYAR